MTVVFVLQLEDDGSPHFKKKFVRLPPPPDVSPFVTRFLLTAGAKATQQATLVTNYPLNGQSSYDRTRFYRRKFQGNELSDWICDLEIKLPGIYEYHVEYQDWETGVLSSAHSGSLLVDPRLYLPPTNILDADYSSHTKNLLPLDAIVIISVIPKWMPTLSQWMPFFNSFSNTGYNMVHFAPVNARGISNSPYSIYDQLSISDDLFEKKLSESEKEAKFKFTIDQIRETCGMLSITDVVWNHTACNSLWLEEHPEAGYNLVNSPHLRPANEVDVAILEFSESLGPVYGLNPDVQTEGQLNEVMTLFKNLIVPGIRLWEFYVIDVKTSLLTFADLWESKVNSISKDNPYKNVTLGSLSLKEKADRLAADALVVGKEGHRFSKMLVLDKAVYFVQKVIQDIGSSLTTHTAVKEFESILNEINLVFYKEYDNDLESILTQVTNRARYLRVAEHGPRLGPISKGDPLVDSYFTRLPYNERTAKHHPDELILANNGWIWNADPLVNFASKDSKAYLRREVIAWGDCVKLRYGDKPEDSPWLWDRQKKYTEMMARLFDGFRIDNCHSTPIHVAAYLLDVGRKVNPDLYVFAELFTGSEEKDIIFVSKLGINSLIREAMSAWDTVELSRQVHRQGGQPVGSFTTSPEKFPLDMLGHKMSPCYFEPAEPKHDIFVDLKGSTPHALFMDCTHDNETPHQRRTAEDTLPNAAIVAMTNCAVGSVKGYDEIVPSLLNVVTETRMYRVPEMFEGIISAKSILYNLHYKMAKEGYSEIHVHQEHDYISIHRVNPVTHDGYLLIARTAFRPDHGSNVHQPIVLKNQGAHVIESASLKVQSLGMQRHQTSLPYEIEHGEETDNEDLIPPQSPTLFYHPFHFDGTPMTTESKKRDAAKFITGMPCSMTFSTSITNLCKMTEEHAGENDTQTILTVDPENFAPGSIVVYRTWLLGSGVEGAENVDSLGGTLGELSISIPVAVPNENLDVDTIEKLWQLLGLSNRNRGMEVMLRFGSDAFRSNSLWVKTYDSTVWPPGLGPAVEHLGLEEINIALYRSGMEEVDATGNGLYNVPNFGELAYGGLQGFVTCFLQVARNNDLGHPICANLRAGPWMLDYVIGRLERHTGMFPRLELLSKWLRDRLEIVKRLPPAFLPKYFFTTIVIAYQGLRFRALELSSTKLHSFPTSLDNFEQSCKMVSFQMYGSVASTGLFPREYPLEIHYPSSIKVIPIGIRPASLAAGLPHFSTHHMRCWGRDVFISLRGLFLIPGHFDEARAHLIAFGSTLKHGLIPNLLDQGVRPRYNARDATWWWLWAVAEYCRMSPEGIEFLGAWVARRFVPLKRYTHGPNYNKDYPLADENPHADDYIAPDDPLVYTYQNTIAELCHEILDRHARGIHFREWNAGTGLDHAMSHQGFDVDVFTDWDNATGFVHGGSRFNCGTWMDKMGDSDKARTKGVPATPRDGADVEIIGLQKAALRWISEILKKGDTHWKWHCVRGVVKGKEEAILYSDWNRMVQDSFEKYFYIPMDPKDDSKHVLDAKLINRRGMYKDTCGSCTSFADYQLRPNICVAMVMAPELFDVKHAVEALEMIKTHLAGPLGIKTLDPADWAYRGVYDNSNDSDDSMIAHGFNYHQGPEWVWIYGFFLRAYLSFGSQESPEQRRIKIYTIQRWLQKHKLHIQEASFAGLPELTNKDGQTCHGSCPTQAWSCSVMIELLDDLKQ